MAELGNRSKAAGFLQILRGGNIVKDGATITITDPIVDVAVTEQFTIEGFGAPMTLTAVDSTGDSEISVSAQPVASALYPTETDTFDVQFLSADLAAKTTTVSILGRSFVVTGTAVDSLVNALLTESGDTLTLENGDVLALEA